MSWTKILLGVVISVLGVVIVLENRGVVDLIDKDGTRIVYAPVDTTIVYLPDTTKATTQTRVVIKPGTRIDTVVIRDTIVLGDLIPGTNPWSAGPIIIDDNSDSIRYKPIDGQYKSINDTTVDMYVYEDTTRFSDLNIEVINLILAGGPVHHNFAGARYMSPAVYKTAKDKPYLLGVGYGRQWSDQGTAPIYQINAGWRFLQLHYQTNFNNNHGAVLSVNKSF